MSQEAIVSALLAAAREVVRARFGERYEAAWPLLEGGVREAAVELARAVAPLPEAREAVPEARPVWRPAKPSDLPFTSAARAFQFLSHLPEKAGESSRLAYAERVNRWAEPLLRTAEQYDLEGNAEAADLVRDLLNQGAARYRAALRDVYAARARTSSAFVTGAGGRNWEREERRRATAAARESEADNVLPDQAAEIRRELAKLMVRQAGGEAKYREKRAEELASAANIEEAKRALELAAEAAGRERAAGQTGTFEAGGIALRPGTWRIDEEGRLTLKFESKMPDGAWDIFRSEGWRWSPSTGLVTRKYTNAAVWSAKKLAGAEVPGIELQGLRAQEEALVAARAKSREEERLKAKERAAVGVSLSSDPDPIATLTSILKKRSDNPAAGRAKNVSLAVIDARGDGATVGYRLKYEGEIAIDRKKYGASKTEPTVFVYVEGWPSSEGKVRFGLNAYRPFPLRNDAVPDGFALIPPDASAFDVASLIRRVLASTRAETMAWEIQQ